MVVMAVCAGMIMVLTDLALNRAPGVGGGGGGGHGLRHGLGGGGRAVEVGVVCGRIANCFFVPQFYLTD